MREGFLYRKLVRPLVDLLRQGVSPEKIALSVALGVTLGVFPVLGSPPRFAPWPLSRCS
jgi:uncharacterized protein (DUF2062 family)